MVSFLNDDAMRFDEFVKFYKQIGTFIRKNDKKHLITGGDAHVRYECTSRR
jgi:hypothetical protein